MNKAVTLSLLLAGAVALRAAAPSASSPSPKPPAKKEQGDDKKKDEKSQSPFGNLMDSGKSGEPTTTEIYSDEAFFDSAKSMGIFSGHVKVVDPRFNLQSDKLTVFISKSQSQDNQTAQSGQSGQATPAAEGAKSGQGQGLEKAIAEGNVGVVRDRPDPNGGPPTRAVGRADIATYLASTGDVELKGNPRVQQGENTHVASSPDTVMVINQNGQLTTHGPSRTEIRQQPKGGDEADKGDGDGKNKDGDGKKKEGKGEKKAEKKEDKAQAKAEKSPTPKK